MPTSTKFIVCPDTLTITCNDIPVKLTKTQFLIFIALSRVQGKALSRKEILKEIHGESGEFYDQTIVTSHVKIIRKKFTDIDLPNPIGTVYGIGYCIPDDIEIQFDKTNGADQPSLRTKHLLVWAAAACQILDAVRCGTIPPAATALTEKLLEDPVATISCKYAADIAKYLHHDN